MIPFSETLKRKSEAKKYLDKVIDQMSLADSDLRQIISPWILKLIQVSLTYSYLGKTFQFNANPDISEQTDKIIESIRREIFNTIYIRAEYVNDLACEKEREEKNRKWLPLFIGSAIAGKTLDNRIKEYTKLIRSEIEAYIAAGIVKGLSGTQILNEYLTWLKKPFASPLIMGAFKISGFKADRLVSKGITFGIGKYVSGFNNLHRLQQQTIFSAYNHILNTIWLGRDLTVGWYTVRGSAYPCNICDDNIGVFHPKDEFFYGYHIRCCCIMLPIYTTDLYL